MRYIRICIECLFLYACIVSKKKKNKNSFLYYFRVYRLRSCKKKKETLFGILYLYQNFSCPLQLKCLNFFYFMACSQFFFFSPKNCLSTSFKCIGSKVLYVVFFFFFSCHLLFKVGEKKNFFYPNICWYIACLRASSLISASPFPSLS